MYCPKCGLQQADTNTVCQRCGRDLTRKRPPAPTQPEKETTQQPAQPTQPDVKATPQPEPEVKTEAKQPASPTPLPQTPPEPKQQKEAAPVQPQKPPERVTASLDKTPASQAGTQAKQPLPAKPQPIKQPPTKQQPEKKPLRTIPRLTSQAEKKQPRTTPEPTPQAEKKQPRTIPMSLSERIRRNAQPKADPQKAGQAPEPAPTPAPKPAPEPERKREREEEPQKVQLVQIVAPPGQHGNLYGYLRGPQPLPFLPLRRLFCSLALCVSLGIGTIAAVREMDQLNAFFMGGVLPDLKILSVASVLLLSIMGSLASMFGMGTIYNRSLLSTAFVMSLICALVSVLGLPGEYAERMVACVVYSVAALMEGISALPQRRKKKSSNKENKEKKDKEA